MHTVVVYCYYDSKYYWFGEHRPAKGFSTEVGSNLLLILPIYVNWKIRGGGLCLYRKKRAIEHREMAVLWNVPR